MRAPDIRVLPPGPTAKDVVERDHRYIATTTKTNPIVARRAEGCLVEDVDGNVFIDFASGISVVNLGHCHPKVVKAIQQQAAELIHFAGTDFYYDIQTRLAEALVKTTPGDYPKKVFFTNSGTEAVEAALKIARFNRQGKQFVGFYSAFHGRTMGSIAFTASKAKQHARFFPWMPGVHHVTFPYLYRRPEGMSEGEYVRACIGEIERLFHHVAPPEEFAGILLETIQGEGGYIVPPKEWIQEVQRIARKHQIFLIADEVQSGMGRTGKMWAVEHFGVTPDVLCTAKALGNGMPIGGAVFPASLDFSYPGAHSNTFGGNPVACAAAMATLEVFRTEGILENATKMGERMRKRLLQFKDEYEIVGDVRGLGLMQATEFVTDKEGKGVNEEARDRVTNEAMRRGLVLLPCGESTLRYIPPLTIDGELLDAGLDVLEASIAAVERGEVAKSAPRGRGA
jgi:4-aminobutyrate aminotransferase